jgi:hypothetical protein
MPKKSHSSRKGWNVISNARKRVCNQQQQNLKKEILLQQFLGVDAMSLPASEPIDLYCSNKW